ncbi:hypothetical protein FPOA_06824 [Fusarium poae]|jgi:hypothetical protein|uniref:Uncharacterized protein n=1 Tax=Fusarium poae TaxID=36050 RepID=A0A1B8AIR7_FUSPO|nr:hypothetical protein FPOA_06824 [Fusarium poae]
MYLSGVRECFEHGAGRGGASVHVGSRVNLRGGQPLHRAEVGSRKAHRVVISRGDAGGELNGGRRGVLNGHIKPDGAAVLLLVVAEAKGLTTFGQHRKVGCGDEQGGA